MTPEERVALAIRLFELNRTMRDLREHIDAAAILAKASGATGLAFATFHLSDSIAVYTDAMNRYVTEELSELP